MMSDEEKLPEELIDTPLGEKLADVLFFAEEYLHHVMGKFVFKYMLYISHGKTGYNPNLYCYEFRLPNNIKLSIITDNYRHLEYYVWYNYTMIKVPKIKERTVQIVLEYLAMRVEDTLDSILDSIVVTLDKELNRR